MSRMFKLALVGVLCALGTVSIASSAAANGGGDFITKCQFDCADALAPIENPLSGTDFDFEIGLKAISDDLAITIQTSGSVYIVGDVQSTGQVKMRAEDFYIDANITSESLRLYGSDFDPIEVFSASVLTSTDLDLGSGFMSPTSEITVLGSGLSVIDDMLGKKGDKNGGAGDTTYLQFFADGDVYIDVSMVKLARLFIDAGESIVLSTEPGMMIPEPTSATLIGLGLVGLAATRLRERRGATAG